MKKHGVSIGRRVATRKSSKSLVVVRMEEETEAGDEDMVLDLNSAPSELHSHLALFAPFSEWDDERRSPLNSRVTKRCSAPVIGTPVVVVDDRLGTPKPVIDQATPN
ncbi:hypothetical protein L1887_10503 [Cichorium endivia]|nr:hypothetical protein L1887_10503 [Cichorium endivia]